MPQSSPFYWGCLPTAFAIALDVPVRQLLEEIGHDGSEIVFPHLKEPLCRRSFHPQELIDSCLIRRICPLIVEAVPILATPDMRETSVIDFKSGHGPRLTRFMHTYIGVLCGDAEGYEHHAVAWDGQKYYNTDGTVLERLDFNIREFIAFIPLA